jgi:hypothetical protein
MTIAKSRDELTLLADLALRSEPGCETSRVTTVQARQGRN